MALISHGLTSQLLSEEEITARDKKDRDHEEDVSDYLVHFYDTDGVMEVRLYH